MIRDILRFYREAPLLLADNSLDVTLGHYVSQHGYGSSFVHDHLLPMAGAIWSAPAQTMLDFPVVSFVRFCVNHGLLQLSDRPQWRTVTGGSREYVRRLLEATKVPVRLNSPVLKISRSTQGVTLHTAQGAETFDDVVIGVHADQALSLLDYPTRHEQQTLSAFQYQKNLAVLHSDSSLMPKRKGVWAAWNYLGKAGADGARHLSVTYWMNRLQHLPCAQPILVTLNPGTMPRDNLVFRQFDYDHPLFDTGAMLAQSRLPLLQGQGGTHTWYCGSYFGYGFHEDAFASGVAAAQSLCHSTMVPS
jgi:predicted NAD/FAD-binding protein